MGLFEGNLRRLFISCPQIFHSGYKASPFTRRDEETKPQKEPTQRPLQGVVLCDRGPRLHRPASSPKPSKTRMLTCVTTEGLSGFHILFKFEVPLLRCIVPAQLWVVSVTSIQRGQDDASSGWQWVETDLHAWLALLGQTPSVSMLSADLCASP